MYIECIYGIQYLRAIAAVIVVIYHAGLRADFGFHIGGAGVDIFFVISGAIMWIIAADRPADPRGFLLRRFARIVPLYWLVTICVFVIALALPRLMPQMETDAGRFLQSLIFIPHLDRSGQVFPVLAVGWTLNFEMFFYAIFALVMVLPRRFWLPAMTAILVGLSSMPAVAPEQSAVLATYTDPLLLEFAAGLWLGWLWQRRVLPSARAGVTLAATGIALLAVQHLLGFDSAKWRPLLWGVPAVLIVLGALSLEAGGRMPMIPWLEHLGDASYSIYLLHGPLVGLIWRLSGQPPLVIYVPLVILLCVAAGWLSWRFFEQPFGQFLRTVPSRFQTRRA